MSKKSFKLIIKIIVCIAIVMLLAVHFIEVKTENEIENENDIPQLRVICGNYVDYQVIETVDGNQWQIDDEFEENQLVQLCFDTYGTLDVTDDKILNIKIIND